MHEDHQIEWTPEQVARFWDYQSKRPSAAHNYFSANHGSQIARHTLSHITKAKHSRILDFGCGTGQYLKHLFNACPKLQLSGLDSSSESIRAAHDTCASISPPPDLRTTHDFTAPWPDGSFDTIYSIEVVEHLSDEMLGLMIAECRRLLNEDGYLIITTPSNENLEKSTTCCPSCGSIFHVWQHVRNWTKNTLSQFMTSRKFSEISVTEEYFGPAYMRLMIWVANRLNVPHSKLPHIVGIYRKSS